MNKTLPYKSLSQREVPEHLDLRIIAYAGQCSKARKLRKRRFFWSGIAAALCITALTGVYRMEEQSRSRQHHELLAMGDFTRLYQNGYNMSLELASGMDFN